MYWLAAGEWWLPPVFVFDHMPLSAPFEAQQEGQQTPQGLPKCKGKLKVNP
jgi:hypothetical protein